MRTLFNQTLPLRERWGLHGSQNTLFKQSRLLQRPQDLQSSQNLDFHANIIHTRRYPFFAIYAYARGKFEGIQLVEYTQSIAMVLLYMNCVRKHLRAGRRKVFTKRVYLKMATNGQSCGHSSMVYFNTHAKNKSFVKQEILFGRSIERQLEG